MSRVDLQPGEYVEDGRPVFSIVEDKAVWITANLKETELTNIQLGHQATIRADAYPNFEFKGRVDSIAPATGAEFSLLPPQNASGNWVKVVQRIPVRLEIEESDNSDLLRAGMSVRIEVDTGVEPDLPAFLKTAVTLIRENRFDPVSRWHDLRIASEIARIGTLYVWERGHVLPIGKLTVDFWAVRDRTQSRRIWR